MHKKELWLRLKQYQFHHVVSPNLSDRISQLFGGADASVQAFASKIAHKHHWKKKLALGAINEYKKFVYLGLTQPFQVTPSKVIDVIWHEHILFSKAYRDFCETILHSTFDHYPELVPLEDETGRFSAQYLDTLLAYKTEFGVEAPALFWGNTKFPEKQLGAGDFQSKKNDHYADSMFASEGPLITHFSDYERSDSSFSEFSGFGEGGDGFDGGGVSDSWDVGDSHGDSDSGGDSGGCSGGCGSCGGGD